MVVLRLAEKVVIGFVFGAAAQLIKQWQSKIQTIHLTVDSGYHHVQTLVVKHYDSQTGSLPALAANYQLCGWAIRF